MSVAHDPEDFGHADCTVCEQARLLAGRRDDFADPGGLLRQATDQFPPRPGERTRVGIWEVVEVEPDGEGFGAARRFEITFELPNGYRSDAVRVHKSRVLFDLTRAILAALGPSPIVPDSAT